MATVTHQVPEIFVLWHPACELGETLASKIYAWLRPENGLGPQVFYRSAPAPEAPPRGLPPPLPGEQRAGRVTTPQRRGENLQILIVLADAHLVADPTWRAWLRQLAVDGASSVRRVFIPVALDGTAFNVPPPLGERNFLRPTGANEPDRAERERLVTRSLLKQLTEVLCRLLLRDGASDPEDDSGPKIKVFLSHAKVDGTSPAKSIRDHIYSQTQIAAFYDENDIPFGQAFARVIDQAVSTDTAALIAVQSAVYHRRPWCRFELSRFRRPIADAALPQHWRLPPVLVVDAIAGGESSRGIPELGNAPIVRWKEDAGTAAEQAEEIVTTVLREAVLAAFHHAAGRALHPRPGPGEVVTNWLPDPVTLLPIVAKHGEKLVVHYPGRGLSGLELDILFELFPAISFRSFEESLP